MAATFTPESHKGFERAAGATPLTSVLIAGAEKPPYASSMTSTAPLSNLDLLKFELQSIDPAEFERLVAALVGKLIGVGVTIAKSGFQHGGDAGTAGRQGRHLRVETKRYADNNPLNERELLGELEQAAQRDPALELWILGATREVKEQLETSLFKSGLKQGVPVLIVDWKQDSYPVLAALCASAPDLVASIAGTAAGDLARSIVSEAATAIEQLKRELSAWHPGYEAVRASARDWILRLWNSVPDAVATFGQDAAGGADASFITRRGLVEKLNAWRDASDQSPATVVGEEGMGKTWATLGWLADNADGLPIPLIVPSGAMPVGGRVFLQDVKSLLAARLHEVTNVRDVAFWVARLDRMFARPESEGPSFTLMLDGMNEAPEAPWLPLFQQLQAQPFVGQVRIISTTRPMFLETKLRNMTALVSSPIRIDVGPYGLEAGGEFDQMLAAKSLNRADIRDELVPLASVPRLFGLVVDLRDRLRGPERITIHRVLWEYGRDSLGVRGGRAFDEDEWQAWLAIVADQLRQTGRARFTRGEVEQMTARPTLGPAEVIMRLSDIVDSHISDTDAAGRIVLRPDVVAHALGAAILTHLSELHGTAQTAAAALDAWLGPISGLSERGEILRAAVAILCVTPGGVPPAVANATVVAWLSTQNLPEDHFRDVLALASEIVEPLLYAVETITSGAMAGSRAMALDGLRSISRGDEVTRAKIIDATTRWMRMLPRDVHEGGPEEAEQRRAERMIARLGRDDDGRREIFGVELEFVATGDGGAYTQVPDLMDGYPLASFVDLFELASLHLAIRGRLDIWSSLKWLTLLNVADFEETASALAARSEHILTRRAEEGVEPLLAKRVAALLLWLANEPKFEQRAQELDPDLENFFRYEDYEADPSKSTFALERRHAEQVLSDTSLAPLARARRLENFWWDPTLVVPDEVKVEMIVAADMFETARLGRGPFKGPHDLDLDDLAPALARSAPDALARLARRRIASLAQIEEIPPLLGDAAYDALLIGDGDTSSILERTRALLPGERGKDEDGGIRQLLLQPEIVELDAEDQVDAILMADLPQLFTNMNPLLKPLEADVTDRLIARYGASETKVRKRLSLILSIAAVQLGPLATSWVEEQAWGEKSTSRDFAFRTLARCCPAEFGAKLLARGWRWNSGEDMESHYGSSALIAGSLNSPFPLIAPRIAPWLIANAARVRGAAPSEVRLAAEILDAIVRDPRQEAPDPGSEITIDLIARENEPFSMSLTPGRRSDDEDTFEQLRIALDQDKRERETKRAVKVAIQRIRAARDRGASLYLTNLDPLDIEPLLSHAETIVDGWLEGLGTKSSDFKRRVRLAESLFVALTEAMMQKDLGRGIEVWAGVRESLETTFIGTGGVDKMLLMLMRCEKLEEVEPFLRNFLGPRLAHRDDLLLDISIAAAVAGHEAWLLALAADDSASGIRWREERAKALKAFSPGENAAPEFPDGRGTSSQINAALWGMRRYKDHAARHWWDVYWSASDGVTAFAAWTLLVTCLDRRSTEWMAREWPRRDASFPLLARKIAFAEGRRSALKRGIQEGDKKLDRRLYGRDIVDDVGPWTKRVPVDAGVLVDLP